MRFDDVLDEAEPDAGALGFAAQFVAEAVEAFEDPLVLGGRDAGAFVCDGEAPALRAVICQGHRDNALVGAEFQGVVEQVDDGLLDGGGIDFRHLGKGGAFEAEGDAARGGAGSEEGDGVAEQGGEVGFLELIGFTAGFDAGEVEEAPTQTCTAWRARPVASGGRTGKSPRAARASASGPNGAGAPPGPGGGASAVR